MSEEIIKVLDYIAEKLGVAIDWTAENALPYVQEIIGKYVTYKIIYYSIGLLIGLLLFIVSCVLIKSILCSRANFVKTKETNFWFEPYYSGTPSLTDVGLVITIVTVITAIAGAIAIGCNSTALLQWSIVPEIALLEEVKVLLG